MKKIRGWKRRVRQLEQWKKMQCTFDNSLLSDYGYDYAKLFNYPDEQHFPVWFKKKVVQALYDVFMKWEENAKRQFDHFYLMIIVNEKCVMDSQLVIAIGEKQSEYKERFIPAHKMHHLPSWLKDISLDWQPYMLTSTMLEDEIETLSSADIDELNIIEKKRVVYEDFMTYEYILDEGIIWIKSAA
jgi:hypothetical protein